MHSDVTVKENAAPYLEEQYILNHLIYLIVGSFNSYASQLHKLQMIFMINSMLQRAFISAVCPRWYLAH